MPVESKIDDCGGKDTNRESRERRMEGRREEEGKETRRSGNGAKGWVIRSFWEN
jgi:hypothetical protein